MKEEKELKKDCPCKYPGCPRHGDCKACKAYHHESDEKTTCEKLAKE